MYSVEPDFKTLIKTSELNFWLEFKEIDLMYICLSSCTYLKQILKVNYKCQIHMNFLDSILLVIPQKCIPILFMNLFSGLPPCSWNQVIVPGHQSARKNVLGELFSQKSCFCLIHQTQPLSENPFICCFFLLLRYKENKGTKKG